jgi:hypothetical protein
MCKKVVSKYVGINKEKIKRIMGFFFSKKRESMDITNKIKKASHPVGKGMTSQPKYYRRIYSTIFDKICRM